MNSIALRERDLASRKRECKSNGLQGLSHLSQTEKRRGQTTQYFNSLVVGFFCFLFLFGWGFL